FLQLVRAAGEAVCDSADEGGAILREYGGEVRMCVALVQENGFGDGGSNLELGGESGALRVARGQVAKIIQPALPDGDDARRAQQFDQLPAPLRVEERRMVRVHACGAPERGRVGRGERRRRPRTGQIRPGHHLACDAGRVRAGDDLGQIAGEAVMRQVRADVDQIAAQEPPPWCVIFMLMCRVAIPVLLALSFAVSPSHAQEGGDLQAQILYAFQAEDTNQLADLVQSLSTQVKAGGADAALRYHLAHAEYRFGLLLGERRSRDAEAALSNCIDQLKQLLQQDAKSVEALALQAACDADLARYKRLEARGLGRRADDRLREAYALAPRNPRVLYLIAVQGLARSK